jgi:hypothetical protein
MGEPAVRLLLLVALLPVAGEAQAVDRKATAAEDRNATAATVAQALRFKGHARGGRAALTQAYGPRPQAALDAIADSMVAIATTLQGGDVRAHAIRTAALNALAAAGMGDNGIVGSQRAIPYAGASARLIRIAEEAADVGIRAAALNSLKFQPNQPACLQLLSAIASSQNSVAWFAVHLLGNETGAAGQAVARQLLRAGTVTEPEAKRTLDGIAQHAGWK